MTNKILPPLPSIDLINLLRVYRNNPDSPAWSLPEGPASLFRCKMHGLTSQEGDKLTDAGRSKIFRLRNYLVSLRHGVSLDTPRENQAVKVCEDTWYRDRINLGKSEAGINVQYTDSILCGGNVSDEGCSVRPHKTGKLPAFFDQISGKFHCELSHYCRVVTGQKLEPVAFQANQWPDGLQVICFRNIVSKEIVRIQAKYYDYICERFKAPSFWQKADDVHGCVIVRVKQGAIPGGIGALIMPVRSEGWLKVGKEL